MVCQYNWNKDVEGYPSASVDGKRMRLHKLLLPKAKEVDHKNRNKLDNQRCNLRDVDRTRNNLNQGLRSDNTSGSKGVYFNDQRQRWMAYITLKRKRYVRYFSTIEEAIKYRKQLEERFGVTNE